MVPSIGSIRFYLSFNLRSSRDWGAGGLWSAVLEEHLHLEDLERPWRDRGAGQAL